MEQQSEEAQIGPLLIKHNLKLIAAESCTGGLISHLITNIAGSSEYFLGSIVSYDYKFKEAVLGVSYHTLEMFGAVSQETALEMACKVRRILGTEFSLENLVGLSVTGIAGPGGGTPQKPVGLVWIALDTPTGSWVWKHNWNGDREENKVSSARAAISHLIDYLRQLSRI